MRTTIFSMMLAVAAVAAAQESDTLDVSNVVVGYDYTCQTTDAEGKAVEDKYCVAVLVGSKMAQQMGWCEMLVSAAREERRRGLLKKEVDDETVELFEERQKYVPRVWTNYPEGKTTMREVVLLNTYETVEKRTEPAWEIMADTMTVGGYLCQRAMASVGGRRWTAWFTEEVPVPYGPWLLGDLPGLIVKAEADGAHRFELFSMEQKTVPIVLERSASVVRSKRKAFVAFRNKTLSNPQYVKDPTSLIGKEMLNHISMMNFGGGNTFVVANGFVLNMKPNVFVPLDLE